MIECGSCLAGGRMDVDLEVKNSGGEGRFSVRATTHHQHHQQVCLPTTGSSFCVEGDFPGEDNFLTVAFLCDFGHSVVIHTNFESLGIVLLLCLCMMGPDRYNIHVHYVKLTCTLCDDSISWYRPWVLLHMWLLLRPHSADVLGTIVLHTLSRYGNGD